MNLMKVFLAILLLSCGLIISGCTSQKAVNSIPVAGSKLWISDPAYASNLGQYIPIDNFQIQIPSGYTQLQTTQVPGMARFTWGGIPQNGTINSYMIFEVHGETALAQQENYATAVRHWEQRITAEFQPNMSDYAQTPVEIGEVNGMPAARIYARGVTQFSDGNSKTMHLIAYRIRSKAVDMFITAYDVEPYSKTSLPIMEASCLTMKPSNSK